MSIEKQLSGYTNALSDKTGRQSTYGCDEQQLQAMIDRCRVIGEKPYCAVSGWMIWHVELPDKVREMCKADGFEPSIVYATNTILDELKRWEPGNSVRTSYVVAIHDNCIVETQNTFYILIGNGTEKDVLPNVVGGLFF